MKLSVYFEYFDKATAPMRRTERQTVSLTESLKQMQQYMSKTNQTAQVLGRLGDTVGQLSRPGIEFQQSMANLSSVTGFVGKDLERLGETARRIGISSGIGASGAADALGLLASLIDVDKIGMDGLIELQGKAILLAQASGMSMTEAANSMTGVINQFGLEANQAGRIINILAAGSKYGAATIPQLAESFKIVGDVANTAGLSVESAAGAIEVLSKNNLKGVEAGTALRNVVLKMQTVMGVNFSNTSFQEALIELKPHMKDVTYMSKLFGIENVVAAQFLVENTDLLKELTDRVTDTNVAQEQAAIRTNTWSQHIKVQTAQFNDWAISLQQNFGGIMNFLQVGGQIGNIFMTLLPVGKVFGAIGVGVWKAGLGVVRFGRTLRMLSLVQKTKSAFGYAMAVGRCGIMGRIAAGLLAGYNRMISLGAVLLNKATWAQVRHAVAGKFLAFWTGIGTKANLVAASVMSAWRYITAAATWTELRKVTITKLHTLCTLLSSRAMRIAGAVTMGWTKITKVAAVVQGGLTKVLRGVRTVMMTGVLPALSGVIAATWAWTVALLANPVTWIVLAIGALITGIVLCWQKFAGFRAVILTIWDAIKGFGMALFTWMVTPLKVIWTIFSGLGKAIYKLFTGDFKGAAEEFTGAFKDGFTEGVEGVKKTINGVKDTAAGISGNYEMHLTEERAKQKEKEEKKIREEKEKKVTEPSLELTGSVEGTEIIVQPGVYAQEADKDVREMASGFVVPAVPDINISSDIMVNPAGQLPDISVPDVVMNDLTNFIMPPVPEIITPQAQNYNVSTVNAQATELENYAAGNDFYPQMPGKVDINFQPVINISAEMTQKAKDDFLTMMRSFSAELTRMIEEQQRKEGRVGYAVS